MNHVFVDNELRTQLRRKNEKQFLTFGYSFFSTINHSLCDCCLKHEQMIA